MMLLEPYEKYAKKHRNSRHQDPLCSFATTKHNCNFFNCQELLNSVFETKKEGKCMKCKNKEIKTTDPPQELSQLTSKRIL